MGSGHFGAIGIPAGDRGHQLVVDSYANAYDVVVDGAVMDDLPAVGSILSGQFWLACRRVAR